MAVKLCKSCGESNTEGALLCVVCSSSLKDSQVEGTLNADKQFTGALTNSRTTCWYCDEKLEDSALKCKYCGSTVIRGPVRVTSSNPYPTGSSTDGCAVFLLFAVTLIIPIVGLIVGGIFAFSEDPDKQSIGKGLLLFGLVMIVLLILIRAIVG